MKSIVIYGVHAVKAALDVHPETVLDLWLSSERDDESMQQVEAAGRAAGIAIQPTRSDRLADLAKSNEHQGVVARRRLLEAPALTDVIADANDTSPLVLVLDQIQDPHNLGACLRVADAAGVDAIVVPSRRSAQLTGSVFKVASGAAETVPVIEVPNLARVFDQMKEQGMWITGLADEAEATIHAIDFTGPVALVMGNEHSGLRALTRERCDFLARIPMAGAVESLNVGMAAGVVLFEAVRQRNGA